ncbi:hypothetical protein D1007_34378 [Hordeum vulgare]|nr:hypothetical protein D1007_34378 [Hordeum vulgare]
MEEWHCMQAWECDVLSRRGGTWAWRNFNRLHELLWPTSKRLRMAEHEFFEAKETVMAGEERVVVRLEAAHEEYDFLFALFSSTIEYHLHVKKDDDEQIRFLI